MLKSRAKRNLDRLQRKIDELIDSIEIEDSSAPSAKPYILKQLELILYGLTDEAKKWPPHMELHYMAYKILYNIAFDSLCSDVHNLHHNRFDEQSPAKSMKHILEACLDYYVIAGIYGESWRKAQLEKLAKRIARAERK